MERIYKWNGIDQLAEDYLSASPYAYVLNNPINMFDPDGRASAMAIVEAMWNATPDGTNSYWFNDGGRFTSYDGGPRGAGVAYSSTVNYNGVFTMGDGTYALPPVITNGQGNSGNWNKGDNYLPNILAMGMAFNQSLAGFFPNGGGRFDSMAWVRNDGPVKMIGGFGDPVGIFDVAGQVMST